MVKQYEVVKFVDNQFELDVRTDKENDTVWLTQDEIAYLFNVDRTRITRHISNIYKDGELDKNSTCAENAHMGKLDLQNYKVKLYNLDMIISIGYRVKSPRGIIFRRWANKDYNYSAPHGAGRVLSRKLLKLYLCLIIYRQWKGYIQQQFQKIH